LSIWFPVPLMMTFFSSPTKEKSTAPKAWEIAETSRQAKGQAVVNILDIDQDELILSVIAISDKKSNHFIMATKKGLVKKTKIKEFDNMRTSGLIAMRMKGDDELVMVDKTTGSDHVFLFTKKGKGIRFPETNVRPMGRATTGMKGIKLDADDEIISMVVLPGNLKKPTDKRKKYFRDILTVSEKGLGKRTKARLFPIQKRAGKGVKAAVINDKTGSLAAARVVTEKVEQVLITSTHGQVIKLPLKNIPQMGRSTQGVIMMRFAKKSDLVAAMAVFEKDKIVKEEEEKA
jgi:DNA gyrase subunit A